MTKQEKLEKIIYLIQQSDLDQTIKGILIRDLQSEGLTEFLKEQIQVYCLQGMNKLDERIAQAEQALE